jgi:8-amino-7-oxononanoate synthase
MRLEDALAAELAEIESRDLLRRLRRIDSAQGIKVSLEGRPALNFSSNDYLGLAWHPALIEAAARAVKRCGTGAGASRLVCGHLDVHDALDHALASFKGTEAALAFSSGYAAALGCVPALVGKGDTVIIDKLAHACLVDAARLSGATLRVYPHNNLAYLERLLRSPRRRREGRTLVITESIFSMDGDTAPLAELVELKDRYGAWLMVDEAHGTGLYGPYRRGRVEACGLGGRVEVQMGTLSKALGSSGGFIAGSRALIAMLVNRARTFIYSTAPSPASAAAALAALEWLGTKAASEALGRLFESVRRLRSGLALPEPKVLTPIVPLVIGSEAQTLAASEHLLTSDVLVPAIRYPTVPRGKARLRITLSANHTPEQIDYLLGCLTRPPK